MRRPAPPRSCSMLNLPVDLKVCSCSAWPGEWDLRSIRCVTQFRCVTQLLPTRYRPNSRLDSQRGSYKGPRQVCRLCVLSGLGFELPERTGINDHAIELVNGQKPPYGPIYSLGTTIQVTRRTGIRYYWLGSRWTSWEELVVYPAWPYHCIPWDKNLQRKQMEDGVLDLTTKRVELFSIRNVQRRPKGRW